MDEREIIVKPGRYKCNVYELFVNGEPFSIDGTPIPSIVL